MIAATQAPTIAVRALARLVASTAAFQTIVGATGENAAAKEASALAHVYWQEADDRDDDEDGDADHPRPRAIISRAQYTRTKQGAGDWATTAASIVLTIEANEPDEISGGETDELRDRFDWWENTWGEIVSQMEANADTNPASYLNITGYSVLGADEVRHEGPTFFDAACEFTYF